MNTHVRHLMLCLAALSAAMFRVSAAQAGWFYEFESPLPPTFESHGYLPDGFTESTSFDWSTEGGVLRLFDTLAQGEGGSRNVMGTETSQVFTDVTVTAKINPTEDGQNFLGVFARSAGATSYSLGFRYGQEISKIGLDS